MTSPKLMDNPNQLPGDRLLKPLQDFAQQVTAKFSVTTDGEPEDQLRAPVETLLRTFGQIISKDIVLEGEARLRDRLGKPDFAAHDGRLLTGYVELKAPGKGANPAHFKDHDRDQWNRFKNVPNILYTDGNEWAVYQDGELFGKRLRLTGDVCTAGKSAVALADARRLFDILAAFTSWSPIVPKKAKDIAQFLAPYCRLVREDVLDALWHYDSPLHALRKEIKQLLFPDATDRQFADAYAQTVIFAMLLAQMEGADVLNLRNVYETLASHHLLLSRSLEFLTDPQALREIWSSISLAQRVIHEVPPESLKADDRLIPEATGKDPWLFFYEHFLAAYDPRLRKEWGVYYTPVEVVRCQVRLIDEILNDHLGKHMGFVEPGVITLDPALGTGTYLMAIIDHALDRVEKEEGPGAVKGGARSLTHNLHGFEWMVGPYAVAQLRFTRALTSRGATLPPAGLGIYLTNTLESPHIKPPAPPLFHQPIAREHERALKVKDQEHVLVCLGNPPYGRHASASEYSRAVTGGWVRHGDRAPDVPALPILEDFLEPARKAGHGVHLKNLYNLYVYFIRWALWKVFEHKSATGPGIVSFITASSYLEGDAFAGVREHMRRVCDHIDIIDLGGEGRGTRKTENVFAIQTPVAIFLAWREGRPNRSEPATVRYTRIGGKRDSKLEVLNKITSHKKLNWQDCPNEWQAPFKPETTGRFAAWSSITHLFPWQNNGVKAGRVWVIDPTEEGIRSKLTRLFAAKGIEQRKMFKDSPTGRKLGETPTQLPPSQTRLLPLDEESDPASIPVVRYAYRSFDRQYVIADARFLDRPGPSVWQAHGEKQVYLTSTLYTPLGGGPALTAAAEIPDLHHFCNRGAKDAIPLYRDAAATEANILPGLLDLLASEYGRSVSPEDLAGYVYAVLAQPEYTRRFERELGGRQVRVPLTKDAKIFFRAAEFGKALIWLHTYGERMTAKERPKGKVPRGKAKCDKAVSEREEDYPNKFEYAEKTKTLYVGDGAFRPVDTEVFEFEVSGLKVVKSWLGYRMRERSGKKSSPLDDIRPKVWTHDFTKELLELLWVLEKTIEGYPEQKKLLEAVLASDIFKEAKLPAVPAASRKPPEVKRRKKTGQREIEM
ncbi:MAG: type ISP restriction/modification enzyme [Planctomycetota bacterium]